MFLILKHFYLTWDDAEVSPARNRSGTGPIVNHELFRLEYACAGDVIEEEGVAVLVVHTAQGAAAFGRRYPH